MRSTGHGQLQQPVRRGEAHRVYHADPQFQPAERGSRSRGAGWGRSTGRSTRRRLSVTLAAKFLNTNVVPRRPAGIPSVAGVPGQRHDLHRGRSRRRRMPASGRRRPGGGLRRDGQRGWLLSCTCISAQRRQQCHEANLRLGHAQQSIWSQGQQRGWGWRRRGGGVGARRTSGELPVQPARSRAVGRFHKARRRLTSNSDRRPPLACVSCGAASGGSLFVYTNGRCASVPVRENGTGSERLGLHDRSSLMGGPRPARSSSRSRRRPLRNPRSPPRRS